MTKQSKEEIYCALKSCMDYLSKEAKDSGFEFTAHLIDVASLSLSEEYSDQSTSRVVRITGGESFDKVDHGTLQRRG